MEEVKEAVEEVKEAVKGEDIYVENDPAELERMLGVAPSKVVPEPEEATHAEQEAEPVDNAGIDQETEAEPDSEGEAGHDPVIQDPDPSQAKPVHEEPVNLSDFMQEDTDSFTYLSGNEQDGYRIKSVPMEDKQGIKKAVRSPDYIFRHPVFRLKHPVLGYDDYELCGTHTYTMYFPEYAITFSVGDAFCKYRDDASMSDYFEDLILRLRPTDMSRRFYDGEAVTVTSVTVLEQGMIEVMTESGKRVYTIKPKHAPKFYRILAYIRELSDSGMQEIPLMLFPEFFTES